MRVVAFWAAIAGLVALGGQAVVLVLGFVGGGPEGLSRIASQVGSAGQIVFTLLLVIFLLIVAVTGRKVA